MPMAAAQGGHTEILRMLLQRARNTAINHTNADGSTAPLFAAQFHHADSVRVLADCGANVNLATSHGQTALHLAVGQPPPGMPPRDPDPDGERQLATVKAPIQLGAAPDPVDDNGMTPLCVACDVCPAKVAVVLLGGEADIDFATPVGSCAPPGCTPFLYAVRGSNTSVIKLLLKRGADGTKRTAQAVGGLAAGSTALAMARLFADSDPDSVETFTSLRERCCSTCGITSPGLAAKTAGQKKHLKRCSTCPARGSRARYCSEECQRADWVSRHRGECAEARRAREAAGTNN